METYTFPYGKSSASGTLLYDPGSPNSVLCDNLEGWDGLESGREVKREGTSVYLWLIHGDVWQKPTQHCKAIILQLNIPKFQGKKRENNPPANAGDIGDESLIPGSGRIPGAGEGNPLQYSCLENSTNRGDLQATVHGIAKSWT